MLESNYNEIISLLQQKLRRKEKSTYYSHCIEIGTEYGKELKLEQYYHLFNNDDLPTFYLKSNDEEMLSLGSLNTIRLYGENSYSDLDKEISIIESQISILEYELHQIPPRLVGGFSFTEDKNTGIWESFATINFTLPILCVIKKKGGRTFLQFNFSKLKQIKNLYNQILNMSNKRKDQGENKTKITRIEYPITQKDWIRVIETAHQHIRDEELEKVVLSRIAEIETSDIIDKSQIMNNLVRNYPECYNFLLNFGKGTPTFFGASPELLCKIKGNNIETIALAGTRPRGQTPEEDLQLSNELMNHKKERQEHQIVVEDIISNLKRLGTNIKSKNDPEIFKLINLQHLLTPISAVLETNNSILDVVNYLHPTPALGGTPTKNALKFIKNYEDQPRGMYASPIGWIDIEKNGLLIVAIRSAITKKNLTWLYAGAGIVRESDAIKEWDEIELKFKPILEALEVIF